MMYPWMQLEDQTEIVHSDLRDDGSVKVYIEKPIEGGFKFATCLLPGYEWIEIDGFSAVEIQRYEKILKTLKFQYK